MKGFKQFLDDVDPYVADFEEVLRVVELSSGFVLLPIGVPGPDLAEMLAKWLGVAKERPTIVNVPEDDVAWKNLASWLLEVKPEKNGVVVVIGNAEIPENFSLAMRLVNERRDAMAKHLDCPLLWCGPKEFLLATAENAPDFWSVRAVERYIKAAAPKSRKIGIPKVSTSIEKKAKNELLHDAIRQGDRQSTEVMFLSQLRKAMADETGEEFDSLLKSIPAGLEQTDRKFRIELGLMRAEMARRGGKISEALEVLDALEDEIRVPAEECRIDLLRGRIWEKAGDTSKAESAYDNAGDAVIETEESLLYLLSRIHSDAIDHRPDWSVSHLRTHRQTAQEAHDRPLEAFAMARLAAATIRKQDRRRAQRFLREATELHESSKNDETVLFPGDVEEALRLASKAIDQAVDVRSDSDNDRMIPHRPTRPLSRFLAIALLVLVACIGLTIYYALTSIPRDKMHCFRSADDKIICGETREHCEKLRGIAGNAALGPCQKPHFAKPD